MWLLVKSSQLKYKFLFCRQDLSTHSSFITFTALRQAVCPTWRISQHTLVSNKLGDYISWCHSCLYLSPLPLSLPSLFSTSPAPDFPNPTCLISLSLILYLLVCLRLKVFPYILLSSHDHVLSRTIFFSFCTWW